MAWLTDGNHQSACVVHKPYANLLALACQLMMQGAQARPTRCILTGWVLVLCCAVLWDKTLTSCTLAQTPADAADSSNRVLIRCMHLVLLIGSVNASTQGSRVLEFLLFATLDRNFKTSRQMASMPPWFPNQIHQSIHLAVPKGLASFRCVQEGNSLLGRACRLPRRIGCSSYEYCSSGNTPIMEFKRGCHS